MASICFYTRWDVMDMRRLKSEKKIQELKNWPLDKIPEVFYVSVRHTTELVCKTDQSS